tara:strand:+ start:1048 stop:1647 length:600 start_codon:yes stop_codon:yes gene_type:complete
MGFNPEDYETVHDRIPLFWEKFPNGRMETEMVEYDEEKGTVVFVARLFREGEETPFATGWAREVRGDGFVNKTSHLENCETSALGRVLANACFSDQNKPRPSREEMSKTVGSGKNPNGVTGNPSSQPDPTVVSIDIKAELKDLADRGKTLNVLDQLTEIASKTLDRKIAKASDIKTIEDIEKVHTALDDIEESNNKEKK